MKTLLWTILLLSSSSITFSSGFIVPQEIPSLLSLVYSNIPPIKKGTDSRIGFGYRLGDHADFQVQFELGPQKDTQPIGTGSAGKRDIKPEDEFQIRKALKKEQAKQSMGPSGQPGSWLQNWFKGMKLEQSGVTTEAPETITSPMISDEALSQLQLLYKSSTVNKSNESDDKTNESEESIESIKTEDSSST